MVESKGLSSLSKILLLHCEFGIVETFHINFTRPKMVEVVLKAKAARYIGKGKSKKRAEMVAVKKALKDLMTQKKIETNPSLHLHMRF